jgi:hypothetical protein
MVRRYRRRMRPDQPIPPFDPTPVTVTKPRWLFPGRSKRQPLTTRQFARLFKQAAKAAGPRENACWSCPSARPGQTARSAADLAHGIRRRAALSGRGCQRSQGGEASPRRHFDGAADQINRHKRRNAIAALVQKPVRRQSGQQRRWTSTAFQTRRAAAAGPVLVQPFS